ncbi:MAG: CBS domain-containing protein [Pseudomonadota bacterium]
MIIRSVGEVIAGRKICSTPPHASVRAACEVLTRENVGALAVIADDALIGVLSERDVIRRAIGQNLSTDTTQVSDIMTMKPVTIGKDASLVEAMETMIQGGFRHLPVIEGDKVIGMLSMRDIPTEYRLMYERYEESFSELKSPVRAEFA